MYMRVLYERDFYSWTQETARLIEKRSLGLSDYRELTNRLRVLMAHLLKSQYQPEKHTKSWDRTTEQRVRLELLLEQNPSLKRKIPEMLPKAYKYATFSSSNDTSLPLEPSPRVPISLLTNC